MTPRSTRRRLRDAIAAATMAMPLLAMASTTGYADSTPADTTLRLGNVTVVQKGKSAKIKEGELNVNAIDIAPMLNRSVSLATLIDRTAGVKLRRQGGTGSDYDLAINGLSGNSVRYFIDGVPLETKGTDLNLNNLPLNLVSRVEVYKGVVPVSLSSDALGGAVNIVTRRAHTDYLDVSIGGGSFHTFNADISGQLRLGKSKWVVRPAIAYNYSKNDYKMKDVEIWDEASSQFIITDRKRFHDDYRSILAQMEIGANDLTWADAFFVSGSYSQVDKDIQTGAMQNKVYGKARRESSAWALSARYDKTWTNLHTSLYASHTWDRSETVDTAMRKYYWDGSWIPSSRNEINGKGASIRVYRRPLTVVRAGVDYTFLGFNNVAINYMLNRSGNARTDRVDTSFEPTDDHLTKHITSLSYTQTMLDGRLINTLFGKNYINVASIRQTDGGSASGINDIVPDQTKSYWGAGVGSRMMVSQPLAIKASYEHSVRLPMAQEVLGNGTTILPNVALNAETSNNYNLGIFGTWTPLSDHTFTYEAEGFIRHVQNYIRASLSERDGLMQYQNEPAIDVKGVDLELSYTWRGKLSVNLNGSYNDSRNMRRYKTDGKPSATYRNRMPNRPWMFANMDIAYRFTDIALDDDALRLSLSTQWVHWYYLNWEAFGSKDSKAVIPTQWNTDLAIQYSWHDGRYNLSLECNDIFDRRLYDNYMLQKPGRAFYAKFRLFLH